MNADQAFFIFLLISLPILFVYSVRRGKKKRLKAIREWKLRGSVFEKPAEGIDYRVKIENIQFDFFKSSLARKRGVDSDASVAYYFIEWDCSSNMSITIQHPFQEIFASDFKIGNRKIDKHFYFENVNANDREILQSPNARECLSKLMNDRNFWQLTFVGPSNKNTNSEISKLVQSRKGILVERFSNDYLELYDHEKFLETLATCLTLAKLGL
jgi:hypothetical protein